MIKNDNCEHKSIVRLLCCECESEIKEDDDKNLTSSPDYSENNPNTTSIQKTYPYKRSSTSVG
jgi:hypothetical protein